MKTKLTLLMVEYAGAGARNHIPRVSFLLNEKEEFINRYVSVHDIDTTLQLLVTSSCNISPLVLDWDIVDLVHEKGSNEVEAIYVARVMDGIMQPRNGCRIVPIERINIEEKYVRSIQSLPRG